MKLLIVDPNVSASSPAMKAVVRSLPALRRSGFEIEVWCWYCDAAIEVDRVVRLPRLGAVRILFCHAFAVWARLRSWWWFSVRKNARPDLIYTVAWYLPDCDVCHVHFSPWDWERAQRELGMHSFRDWVERWNNFASLKTANRFLKRTTARRILCVSDAVAADVRKMAPRHGGKLCVLPNSYDPARFNPAVRFQWRSAVRAALSFAESDRVFIFASTGHHRRKGFFLAVEAVALVRKRHPGARLLVVGGSGGRLKELQGRLRETVSDWREFIRFTGSVPDVEKYFAASDALLFPSYSEAFALVEVEADACGLPLFLTRHHGSEMILRDGSNGRYLEFDAARMAAVLAEFVSGDWRPKVGEAPRKVLASDEYAAALVEIFRSAGPGAGVVTKTVPAGAVAAAGSVRS